MTDLIGLHLQVIRMNVTTTELFNSSVSMGESVALPVQASELVFACLLRVFELGKFCQKCGLCCRVVSDGIDIGDEAIARISQKLKISKRQFRRRYTFQVNEHLRMKAPCLLQKGDLCSVYDVRPTICQFFPLFFADGHTEGEVRIFVHWCPGGKTFVRYIWDKLEEYKEELRQTLSTPTS